MRWQSSAGSVTVVGIAILLRFRDVRYLNIEVVLGTLFIVH